MQFKVELLQTSLNKLNMWPLSRPNREKNFYSQVTYMYMNLRSLKWTTPRSRVCFGKLAKIEQNMNQIMVFRYGLGCLHKTFFHENELSPWKENKWILEWITLLLAAAFKFNFK